MDDLDGSNDMDRNIVYGKGLPLEENIHQINESWLLDLWLFTLNNK
jgi:hypothetical protein